MDWGPIFSAGLQAATQFGTQYFNNQAQKDRDEEQRKYNEAQADKLFAQKKELAEMAPGPAAPFTGFTDPQRVQALQNQDRLQQEALNAFITAYQRALLSR